MNPADDFANKLSLEATIEVLNLGYNIIQLIVSNCILSYICKFLCVLSFYLQKEKVFKVNVVLYSVYQNSELTQLLQYVHD